MILRVWVLGDLLQHKISSFSGTPNFRGSPNPNGFSAVATPHQRFQHGGRQPFHRGTPRSEPGPRGGANYRGAPGFFGTPSQGSFNHFQNNRSRHNFRGSPSQRGNEWRGNNRERYSRSSDSGTGYFHPSMLEDPWADLRKNKQSTSTFSSSSTSSSKITSSLSEILHESMSDSMIPQVSLYTLLPQGQLVFCKILITDPSS